MQANVTRIITTIVVSTLLAAAAAVADDKESVAATDKVQASNTSELNRTRARTANTAAVEDAVEAVLTANKRHLDIRLIGRTSAHITEGR